MSTLAATRDAAVKSAMHEVRAIATKGVDRASVGRMLEVLKPLAARRLALLGLIR